jgi:hypothetical protein
LSSVASRFTNSRFGLGFGERPRKEGRRKWRRECEREKKGEEKHGLGAKKMMAGRDDNKRREKRSEE